MKKITVIFIEVVMVIIICAVFISLDISKRNERDIQEDKQIVETKAETIVEPKVETKIEPKVEPQCPVYLTQNMDGLHLDCKEFDINNYMIRNLYDVGNHYYIDKSNVLWSYGCNDYGQLGIGKWDLYDTDYYETPQKVAENVIHVDASNYFTIFITEAGDLYGMGANLNGLMGMEVPKTFDYFLNPSNTIATKPVCLMNDVKYARASQRGIIALKNDGSVWWWGEIRTMSAKIPEHNRGLYYDKPEKMLDDAIYVTCGLYNMAAIKKDGTLWTWGNNTFGSCGVDSGIDYENSCFYTYVTFIEKKDGSLYACGKDIVGEGSTSWEYEYYGDILRVPNGSSRNPDETYENEEFMPVTVEYSYVFQPIKLEEE